MNSDRRFAVHAVTALLGAAAAFSCQTDEVAVAPVHDRPQASQESQPLLGEEGTYWCHTLPCQNATQSPTFNACWEPGTFNNANLAGVRGMVQDSWARNWQRFARVNFVGFHECNTTLPEPAGPTAGGEPGLHLWVDPAVGGDQNNGAGMANHDGVIRGLRVPECGLAGGPGPGAHSVPSWGAALAAEFCVRDVALHGLGHVLGFWHSEQSSKYTQPQRCVDRIGQIAKAERANPGLTFKSYGAYDNMSVMSSCGGLFEEEGAFYVPDLVPSDIAVAQRVYGRRLHGSLLTPVARCVENGGSTLARLWDCDEFGDIQEWDYDFTTGKLRNTGTDICLGHQCGEGLRVTTVPCSSNNTSWTFSNVQIRGWGGICLELRDGNTAGGLVQTGLCQSVTCDPSRPQPWCNFNPPNANANWTITTAGEIRWGLTGNCLTAPSSGAGQLTVTACSGITRQKFAFDQSPVGHIKSQAFPTKCLDIAGVLDSQYLNAQGMPTPGVSVNLFDCLSAQYNQKWNFSGRLVANGCGNRCLEWPQDAGNGAHLFTRTCAAGDRQTFDFYPK